MASTISTMAAITRPAAAMTPAMANMKMIKPFFTGVMEQNLSR